MGKVISFERIKYIPAMLASALLASCAASPPPQAASGSANETFVKNDLPHNHSMAVEYYPDRMRRLGISGQALLAYSVSDAGRPVRVEVIRTDGPDITRAAAQDLSGDRFSVPPGWEAAQGPQRRFLVEIQYVFAGSPIPATWDSRAELIRITGAPIPRAP